MSDRPHGAARAQSLAGYEFRWIAPAFDAVISAMFLPFGGVRALRSSALDRIGVVPGMRVLELGCGTGAITKLLLERGAVVTAVDAAPRMLERARRRAPSASFRNVRLEVLLDESRAAGGAFDLIVCAFVLHELPAAARTDVLGRARALLASSGRLAIVDHAVPVDSAFARAWRAFLLKLEPPSVRDCIEQGYGAELVQAGYRVETSMPLASGTAQLIVAQPDAQP